MLAPVRLLWTAGCVAMSASACKLQRGHLNSANPVHQHNPTVHHPDLVLSTCWPEWALLVMFINVLSLSRRPGPAFDSGSSTSAVL